MSECAGDWLTEATENTSSKNHFLFCEIFFSVPAAAAAPIAPSFSIVSMTGSDDMILLDENERPV